MSEFTHFNDSGYGKMVDVSLKQVTNRIAVAKSTISMKNETINMILNGKMKKGDVLGVSVIGGIQGIKKTSDLIPMCHSLYITASDIDFDVKDNEIDIFVTVKSTGQTGVEMEALTGASIAALTIYDMCKAVDKEMVIKDIKLLEKSGGKSGYYKYLDKN